MDPELFHYIKNPCPEAKELYARITKEANGKDTPKRAKGGETI